MGTVTQRDIAAACGLSKAAVSRALNGHSDISEETRNRVIRMAETMGYIKPGGPVVKKASFMVGMLATGDAETMFHHAIIMQIRHTLLEMGYDLVMFSPTAGVSEGDTGGDGNLSADLIRAGTARRPGFLPRARMLGLDGLILFSSIDESSLYHDQEYKGIRDLFLSEKPMISVDCSYANCGSVMPAYDDGIGTLLHYVYRMGHRRIACVYGGGGIVADEISAAIRNTCTELGLKLPDTYLRQVKPESAEEAYEAVVSILLGTKWIRPTCFLFGDDYLLEGGIAALRTCGCSVPEDISVVSLSTEYTHKGLSHASHGRSHGMTAPTAWRLSPARIGEEAVMMLLKEIHTPGKMKHQIRRIAGDLQIGETVADIGHT